VTTILPLCSVRACFINKKDSAPELLPCSSEGGCDDPGCLRLDWFTKSRGEKSMVRRLGVVFAFAAVVSLWASGAHAGLIVSYDDGGGPIPILTGNTGVLVGNCDGTNNPCGGSVNDGIFSINLQAGQSNSSGSPTIADVLSAGVSIQNITSGDQTLTLLIGDRFFTNPVYPGAGGLLLTSSVGTTVLVGGATNTLAYTSCVDQGNGQNVCPGTYSVTSAPAMTAVGSSNATTSTPSSPLSAPFSMTEMLVMTLAPGSIVNYSASTLLTPVPEPATMFLGGLGLIAFGYAARRRLFGR
jgi:hypothetical protein